MVNLTSFQRRLNYHFHNSALLKEAFLAAGASASRTDVQGPKKGNKRLALLGDAALRLAVLDKWFEGSANTANGDKQVRDVGTNNRLREVAKKWNVQKYVVENPSQQGQFPREVLAATVEAIIGAVWVDSHGNLGVVQQVLKKLSA